MNKTRFFKLAGLVAIGLLATALPASACSCLQGDPRDQFKAADAAIVGEYVGQRPTGDPDSYQAIYTFNVEEEWKADFGQTLDVEAANNGAACGIEAQPGQRVGLFLTMEGSTWTSSLCAQTSPARMREAASPLPAPDGSGPARLIVGGSFGEARVMSLDANGKTLAYGYGGDHDVSNLDACPGGQRFVEIYEVRTDENLERRLAVRQVSDLEVVRETILPFGQSKYVNALDCRDRDADRVLLFVTPTYGKPDGEIFQVSENGLKRRFVGLDARAAAFGDKHVYLSGAKRRVLSMRLDGGSSKVLYSVGRQRQMSAPQLSANGESLAVIAFGTYESERPSKLVLIPLDGGAVRTRRLEGVGFGAVLVWDGSRTLVVLGGEGSPVFNLRLQKVGGVGPAFVSDAVVRGDNLWGVSYGELLLAALPDGDLGRERMLPSPVTHAIISIPN